MSYYLSMLEMPDKVSFIFANCFIMQYILSKVNMNRTVSSTESKMGFMSDNKSKYLRN